MRRSLLVPAVLGGLALTTPAHAGFGIGTSYGVGLDEANFGGRVPLPYRVYPALDLHIDKVWIQLYPIDLLINLASEDVVLAGSVYVDVLEEPVGGTWQAVLAPGGTVGIADQDGLLLGIQGAARIGVETGQSARAGVYVVPGLGLGFGFDEVALVASGRLEFSVWFGGNGDSAGPGASSP
jgi:hypothetical protein